MSTTPAELLVTRGAPQLSPISKIKLLYVTNTENNLFLDVCTQNYYALLPGRNPIEALRYEWLQSFPVRGRSRNQIKKNVTSSLSSPYAPSIFF